MVGHTRKCPRWDLELALLNTVVYFITMTDDITLSSGGKQAVSKLTYIKNVTFKEKSA